MAIQDGFDQLLLSLGTNGLQQVLLTGLLKWVSINNTSLDYCLMILIVVQIWELGSGKLKLSLTGHISTVRGLVVSPRHPYLFSCGEDKQVKCWDLEYNKVNIHPSSLIPYYQKYTPGNILVSEVQIQDCSWITFAKHSSMVEQSGQIIILTYGTGFLLERLLARNGFPHKMFCLCKIWQ